MAFRALRPLIVVPLLGACAHTLHSEARPKLGATRYAPTQPDSLLVLDFSRPMPRSDDSVAAALGTPFEDLGDVEAYGPGSGERGRSVALASLRRRAAELGADVLVLRGIAYGPPPYTTADGNAVRRLPPMPDAAARCDTLPSSLERAIACREAARVSPREARFRRALAWSAEAIARTPAKSTGAERDDLLRDAQIAVATATELDSTYAWPAAHIAEAMKVMGDSAKAYREIGDLVGNRNIFYQLLSRTRYGGAVAAYREAVRLSPADPEPYYELGEELLSLERHEEALATYAAMARRWPKSAPVWSRVGVAFNRLGRHADAMRAWQRTLDIDRRYFSGMMTIEVSHEWELYRVSEKAAGKQPAMTLDALP